MKNIDDSRRKHQKIHHRNMLDYLRCSLTSLLGVREILTKIPTNRKSFTT
jgi:hypothetical protein